MAKEKSELAVACYNTLAGHGLSLHYEMLSKILREDQGFRIKDRQVLGTLSSNPDLFQKQGEGVYFLKGKKEGARYLEYSP